MRYPIGKDKQDYIDNWYIASEFGEDRDTYFHNGVDFNLRTGGNTDLGQPIYAVSDWFLAYYHYGSHPTRGYGKHYVYQIKGPFGIRWAHCAHNQDCLKTGGDSGNEGDQISTLGNSGTNLAHLHFSIFKVDPKTLRNGIDTVSKTKQELSDWWEDPVAFIEKWIDPPIDWKAECKKKDKEIDEKNKQIGNLEGQVKGLIDNNSELSKQLGECQSQKQVMVIKIESQNNIIGEFQKEDAIQIKDLIGAQEERTKYKRMYTGLLGSFREGLKLSRSYDDTTEAENEAKIALENLNQSKLKELKFSDYEYIIKIGNTLLKKLKEA
jgi:hypothetical protein